MRSVSRRKKIRYINITMAAGCNYSAVRNGNWGFGIHISVLQLMASVCYTFQSWQDLVIAAVKGFHIIIISIVIIMTIVLFINYF